VSWERIVGLPSAIEHRDETHAELVEKYLRRILDFEDLWGLRHVPPHRRMFSPVPQAIYLQDMERLAVEMRRLDAEARAHTAFRAPKQRQERAPADVL
jgi:hypothetical protein